MAMASRERASGLHSRAYVTLALHRQKTSHNGKELHWFCKISSVRLHTLVSSQGRRLSVPLLPGFRLGYLSTIEVCERALNTLRHWLSPSLHQWHGLSVLCPPVYASSRGPLTMSPALSNLSWPLIRPLPKFC